MRKWYVAYTKANAELKALRHLTNQGFYAYLPRYIKQRRHARKTENVSTPLFPRYLFIRLDMDTDRWRPLLSTIGLSHLVCRGEKPAYIDDTVIDSIREHENEVGLIDLNLARTMVRGDKIKVINGPFANLEGLFDGNSSENRVHILMELLGGNVRVEVLSSSVMGQ